MKLPFLKNINTNFLVAICIAVFFLLLYSWFPWQTMGDISQPDNLQVFNSPDETANFWTAYNFYQTGKPYYFSEPSLLAGDIVKPRSFRIVDNNVVPVGFLGLPWLASLVAKLFHNWPIILFITPILAAIALIYFYLLVKKFSNQHIALLSMMLAGLMPAWWYYASRSMMPNVGYFALAIISFFYFYLAINKNKLIYYIFTGLFIGLALLVRPAEAVWLLPVYLLVTFFAAKKINWRYIWLIPSLVLFWQLPAFYWNHVMYGDFLNYGYQLQSGSVIDNPVTAIAPFGMSLAVIKFNVINYFNLLFDWHSLLAILGLLFTLLYLLKSDDRKQKKYIFYYLIILFVSSILLVIFYGSWQFSDNPNPKAVTIGTSYVRYWLPIYIGSLPLIAFSLYQVFKKSLKAYYLAAVAIFVVVFVFSFNNVFAAKQEGLLAIKDTLEKYQIAAEKVLTNTPHNSIIVAKKNDKVFYPRREVIYDLFYDKDWQRLKRLAGNYPVYLWDFHFNQQTINYLNSSQYQDYNLKLLPAVVKYNGMSLYPIKYE